ncbi:deoxyguanosinetriphosphate triphosphohydrolase [Phytoactinopolyspora halotolerans]|uniref:Deoxyguanosinetriphosphate triphosphohydrolase n=1 Tax=Phytoactinopolyspora halotolerans TaxID=1981512 RepID=A0A6L9S630_9ACTN|nr:deoxyguanosinetriphosphate triphosphohydrolase [Phytoactinopolyspora halotolerans]NED99971.1 deoxyguanosinetriphosphate triphosphohydrolase [Phytoactinopolyspora halotolerans]
MDGYDVADRERWAPEPEKRSTRTDFERDRARVLHAASLRRLAAKTQVVSPGSDDFVRNRLTHSLEVAQVGRELGKALGCDPDVVDTACLAHDLGHPPFGHNGEDALDTITAHIGGFEGNAQTLRLLTRLEAKASHPDGRSAGLNLTRASLDAATKYPWRRGTVHPKKFGVYEDDMAVFTWLRTGAPDQRRCLEAQVMDFADDVAYCVHDVEDAIVGGWLQPWRVLDVQEERQRFAELTRSWYLPDTPLEEILHTLDRLRSSSFWVDAYDGRRASLAALKDMTSQLIGRFSAHAQRATHDVYGGGRLTRYAADLCVPHQTRLEVGVLKGLAATYVMTARDRAETYGDQRALVEELVDLLRDRAPEGLEPIFRDDWDHAPDDAARLRVIVDQVASLTDASAYLLHSRLKGAGASGRS